MDGGVARRGAQPGREKMRSGRGRGSGSGSVAVPWRGNESGCRSRSVPGRVTVSGCEPGTGTPAEERPEHHQGPLIIVPR